MPKDVLLPPAEQYLKLGAGNSTKALRFIAESNQPRHQVVFRSAISLVVNPTSRVSKSLMQDIYNGSQPSDKDYLEGFDEYVKKGWFVKDHFEGIYKFEDHLFTQLVPGVLGYLSNNEAVLYPVIYNYKNLGTAINDYAAEVARVKYIVKS